MLTATAVLGPVWLTDAVDPDGNTVTIHGGGGFAGVDEDAGEFFQVHAGGLISGIIGVRVEPGVA